jgi:hypothetical protein
LRHDKTFRMTASRKRMNYNVAQENELQRRARE